MNRRQFLAAGISVSLAGCTVSPPLAEPPDTAPYSITATHSETDIRTVSIQNVKVNAKPYKLKEVSYQERPQWSLSPYQPPYCPYTADEIQDWKTLYSKEVNGEKGHHALRTTRVMLIYLHGYRETNDEGFLTKVEEMSDALLEEQTTESDNALFFNYGFDYTGHTEYEHQAPWFSCMSQGTGLSVYLRLYELTSKDRYYQIAKQIWRSFLNLRTAHEKPWISYRDQNGYLWLEEYPEPDPMNVLNGFVIGLWGPYEYWLLTGDETAKQFVQAAITTLERYAWYFRKVGDNSYYSLLRNYSVTDKYHRLHIYQLRKLAELTGTRKFDEIADELYSDHALDWKSCNTLKCK